LFPLTPCFPGSLLLLLLGVPGGERHPAGQFAIEADLEGVLTRPGQGHIKHQHGTSLHIDDSSRRLTELNRALPSQELASTLIDEADPDGVNPDLGAPSAHPENQVRTGVHCREVRQPDVLKHAEHAELALLIDQSVVGNNRKIEVQLS
jgi:hypothetical protein